MLLKSECAFGKLWAIISSNQLSTSFFLSSSGIPIMCILLACLIVFLKSLRFYNFFLLYAVWLDNFKWFVFKFADSLPLSSPLLSPSSEIFNSVVIFSIPIFCVIIFLIISISLLIFSLCSLSSWLSWSSLW